MGKIEIDHTGSGSGITLSSDGTDLLLDGTAIGGGGGALELYAENPSSPTAPSATGTNAVAIAFNARAPASDAVAIGENAYAQGAESFSIGTQTDAIGTRAGAFGYNALAQGNYSMAFGNAGAFGTESFAAAIVNNTNTYGASGANSIAIGQTSKATSDGSVAIGKSCISDGGRTVALGHSSTASGFYSFAVGALSEALETGCVTTGVRGRSNVQGKRVHSSSTFSAQIGNCQTGELVLGKETTDATPAQLTSIPGNAASATNSITLPNNSCYGFTGTVIARENSAQTNDFAVWEVKGGAVRGANAASTTLGSYNINKISESTGAANWSIALSADATNGAVAITVTGEASHSIRWVATVNTTEVTY